MNALRLQFQAARLVEDDPGAGEPGQSNKIDLKIFARVMPGNIAGQHARVRAGGIRGDKCYARACKRLHSPLAQDERMTMSAPDKDQIP